MLLYKKLESNDIFLKFAPKKEDAKSILVLKKTKTDSSDRLIFLPNQLVKEFEKRKKAITRHQTYFGEDYNNNNLVFCLEDGTHIEPNLFRRWFEKWQKNNTDLNLPKIDIYELKHSSTTYKLRISGSDIKLVQGDISHSTASRVVDTYDHIQNENSKLVNLFEDSFYYTKIVKLKRLIQQRKKTYKL